MPVLTTVEEKNIELKQRKENQKQLSKAVDKMVAERLDADHGRELGCGGPGICPMLGRGMARLLGISRTASSVSTNEMATAKMSSQATSSTTVSSRVFGTHVSKKKASATSKLEAAKASMQARVEQLEERASSARASSLKAMQSGNKPLALRELKRSKMMEKQADGMQAALDAVEQQFEMMEQTALSQEVAQALGATAKSLKKNKALLSQAEDNVDAAVEARDVHDDMAAVMSTLGESASNNYDDDELMAELEGMVDNSPPKQKARDEDQDDVIMARRELEAKHEEYDRLEALRQNLPSAPTSKRKKEKELLLSQAAA